MLATPYKLVQLQAIAHSGTSTYMYVCMCACVCFIYFILFLFCFTTIALRFMDLVMLHVATFELIHYVLKHLPQPFAINFNFIYFWHFIQRSSHLFHHINAPFFSNSLPFASTQQNMHAWLATIYSLAQAGNWILLAGLGNQRNNKCMHATSLPHISSAHLSQ